MPDNPDRPTPGTVGVGTPPSLPREPGPECPIDSHAAHCQCHMGGAIMVDIPYAHPANQTLREKMNSAPLFTHTEGAGLVPRARAGQLLADAAETVGAGGDRHRDYGDAAENFAAIGQLWAVVLGVPEVTAEQVALCMNQVKVARLIHSPSHRDSWVDGMGYLALGGDIAGTPGRHP